MHDRPETGRESRVCAYRCRQRSVGPALVSLAFFAALGRTANAQAVAAATEQPANDSLVELTHRIYGQGKARIRLPSGTPDLVILGPRLVGDTLEFTQYARGSWTLDTSAGRHQVLLAAVADPRVAEMAASRGDTTAVYEAAAAVTAQAGRAHISALLRRNGVEVVDAPPDRLPPALADAYLSLKAAGRL